jgi:hypothetical protein
LWLSYWFDFSYDTVVFKLAVGVVIWGTEFMNDCPIAEALFEDYLRVTKDHVDAAIKLHNLVDSQKDVAQAKLLATDTYKKCKAAFEALAKHGAEHGCFTVSAE